MCEGVCDSARNTEDESCQSSAKNTRHLVSAVRRQGERRLEARLKQTINFFESHSSVSFGLQWKNESSSVVLCCLRHDENEEASLKLFVSSSLIEDFFFAAAYFKTLPRLFGWRCLHFGSFFNFPPFFALSCHLRNVKTLFFKIIIRSPSVAA